MTRFFPYCLPCFFSLIFAVCSDNKPKSVGVIPQEKFIQLYIDILVAGESGYLSSTDSVKAAMGRNIIDSLYASNRVTETQVRQTVEEYNKDLIRWKEFYDEVSKRLEEMQKEEQKRKSEVKNQTSEISM
jgi:hypothetical protein